MLKKLIIKDYTTFIGKTTFDFSATNYKILEDTNVGEGRVLKGALFVGEYASGKTKALKAIVILLDMLFGNTEQNYIVNKSMYTSGTKYNICYIFEVKGKEIEYQVEFMGNSINSEKLYLDKQLKLERLKKSGKTYFTESKDNDNINSTLSLLKLEYYNTRFNNDPVLNEWFNFLKNSIYLNCLIGMRGLKSYDPTKLNEQYLEQYALTKDATYLNEFISKIGYNSEIVFNKQTTNKDNTISLNSENEEIGLRKKGTSFVMPLALESTGNKAFMSMILPIIFACKNNCMIIVDEFSSGLHNELEEALIKYFFNNSNNSQIFFTSHSTNLLDTYILRPDQIYSFSFNSKKGTLIKRFSDENPRESQNLEKMFRNGVFDGNPSYDKEFKD